MVNDGAALGLVEQNANPAHRRSPLIALTAAGRAAITAVGDREKVVLGRTGGELTEADVEGCVRVLSGMLALFDGRGAETDEEEGEGGGERNGPAGRGRTPSG
ncbi:hypothetical protein [Streptomyces tsukubensis]|uniref:hypothetical protein n=1 Tax=Streptomyces tsukubensis TaxID=83656 RepID=UPI003F4EDDF2